MEKPFWMEKVNSNPLPWLLEQDRQNPGVRYLAMRDLLDMLPEDTEMKAAKMDMMEFGPVVEILSNQHEDGWWAKPGAGYLPKYTSTVWQLIFLAQMGADGSHLQIQKGGDYVLDNSRSEMGGFSYTGKKSGHIQCLEGNLCAALIDLGFLDDPRLQAAVDWLARSITGEGIASSEETSAKERYYRSGNSGPGFLCSANDHLPCAWGAVKAVMALARVPEDQRSLSVKKALEQGVEFLFSTNPAEANYPMGYNDKPNRSWFKFGFPVGYVTDVLQILEVLTGLGYGQDERLNKAFDLLLSKQDENGRWPLEYTYNGKTWVDIETKNQNSKWVTLRALRTIKTAKRNEISW